ncbi:hypothetical protein SAMN02910370_00979 [Lachnospiraceae bacterium XPB1003]|nr:hypothetical protein SAMN02910370_00979 [Lachnospiraceae bacterium XPB1003]
MSRESIRKRILRSLRKEDNNRGAAMVSVLIAVAFIAILATSLLYLAYMNYLTKVMRYGSNDDFYTSEYAVDELSSTLQQIAVDKGKAGGNISDAISTITAKVGGGSGTYDNDKVQTLLRAATHDASISVNTAVTSGDNYVTTTNTVTLKGVEITSTSPQGYVSTVRTDIIINFRPQGEGSLDINDFSVISDSPIRCGGDAGDLVLSGCIYCQKSSSHDPSMGSGMGTNTAMHLDDHAVVQMIGDKAVINGDLVIGNGCTLLVSNDTVVYGNVKIGTNSTLIILDKFKVTGSISGSGKYKVQDASKLKIGYVYNGREIPGYGSDPKYSGLVDRLFCDEVYFYDTNGNTWRSFDFETYCKDRTQKASVCYDIINKTSSESGSAADGPYVQVDLSDAAHNYNNTLVLGTNRATKTHSGAKVNTTFTSTKGIYFNSETGSADSSVMQRMKDSDYQKVLDSCFALPFGNSVPCNNSEGSYDFDSHNAVANFAYATDSEFRAIRDNASYAGSRKTKKVGDRTYVYYNGSNYLPVRYLIADDARSKIDAIFSASADTSDPTTSFVEYENWEKK